MNSTGLIILIILLFTSFKTYSGKVIKVNDDTELIEISDGFFMHKSFSRPPGSGRFSSNGLIVVKNGKALMIDTPVTEEQTEAIYNYLKDSLGVIIETFIGGHFHNDCIGGMGFFKKTEVKTILNERTRLKCTEYNLPLPDITFDTVYRPYFEDINLECRYFGGGHTADNIVVYFPESKILYGGCLIKSLDSQWIGNIQDAVVENWDFTVEKIIETFKPIKYVIPGHGDYGSDELLTHTIEIVKKFKGKSDK